MRRSPGNGELSRDDLERNKKDIMTFSSTEREIRIREGIKLRKESGSSTTRTREKFAGLLSWA